MVCVRIAVSGLLYLSLVTSVSAQGTGQVVGTVSDADNGERLPSANIQIDSTAMGAISDLEGRYRLRNIPVGDQTILFSYIGYRSERVPVTVTRDTSIKLDVKLQMVALEGDEIVITAQLQGQAAAINQQQASNTIVNVVSSEKIRELPDQNAAESVGRLPGVSVDRDAGEGTKVVVRGLAPKFNSVTVNGERIPSTDAEDRSVDLSMISPEALAGIEVYKALTPDRDGDAVGGTVNLVTRAAPEGRKVGGSFESGYNAHEGDFGQIKLTGFGSRRFSDNRYGALLTANFQRANRSSDRLNASYFFVREAREGEDRAVIGVNNLNLADHLETRDRFGAGLTLDRRLESGRIVLNTFWSETRRDETRRRLRYRLGASRTERELRVRDINTRLLTTSLSANHDVGGFEADWRLSYSRTKQWIPFSNTSWFQELAAYTADLQENSGPDAIPAGAKRNLGNTFLKYGWVQEFEVRDRDVTGMANLKRSFDTGGPLHGFVKAGAKIRSKRRNRDITEWRPGEFTIVTLAKDHPERWEVDREQRILVSNFLTPSSDIASNFLNGRFEFGPVLDVKSLNEFREEFFGFYNLRASIDLQDYDAGERIVAQYLMAELHLGDRFMLMPGVRFEQTRTDYSSLFGNPAAGGSTAVFYGSVVDTSGSRSGSETLPMLHVRVRPLNWFDLRFAVTRSLSRPNYFNLVPWQRVAHGERTVEEGNPELRNMMAWNYDAFLSIYGNPGMFTVGLFHKKLSDIDYIRSTRIRAPWPTLCYQLTSPVNSDRLTTVRGIELELQTNLKMLPSPLDGVVLYANFAHISSETFFPIFVVGPRSPDPPYRPTLIDTVRVGRMPGQADNIANIAIGYEKRGFSARYSTVYQGRALKDVGTRNELDGFTDSFVRQDLAIKQRITKRISAYFNVNNIGNVSEGAFVGIQTFPTQEEFFGWTADLGLRYRF